MQDLYVLDSGNNRIQKLSVNTCGWTITDKGYIYDASNDHGYGALSKARSIDYCDLPGAAYDLLIVADTGNHRVLFLKANDGSVIGSVGGSGYGHGINQFCFPDGVVATRINDEDCSAFIYVLDKGNNRVVLIQRGRDGRFRWYKSMDFPLDAGSDAFNGLEPSSGLVGITLDDGDDTGIKSGIFVVDDKAQKILHIDGCLNSVLEEANSPGREPLMGCSASCGELAVLSWYTVDEGLRLFETPASIVSLSASPNPFRDHLEWTMVTAPVTASGTLTAVVKDGTSVLDTLFNGFVYCGNQSIIWNGTDSRGNYVACDKNYKIVCTLAAEYPPHGDPYSETKEITVRKSCDSNLVAITSHDDIRDPKWSPDGSEIVFSSQDGTGNTKIRKVNYPTKLETQVTNGDRNDYYPSWTHGGDSVTYAREIVGFSHGAWGPERALYLKASTGQGAERLIGDTTGTPGERHLWVADPRWMPGENAISYVKHMGDQNQDQFRKIAIDGKADACIKQFDGWINYYSWSPFYNVISLTYPCDVYSYDVRSDYLARITSDADSSLYGRSAEWAPGGAEILFAEEYSHPDKCGWEVFTVPATSAENAGPKKSIGIESHDVVLNSSLTWSPDGTKIAFAIDDGTKCNLLVGDYIRNNIDAFPAAYISSPLGNTTVSGTVTIRGRAAHNIGVKGDELSHLYEYYVEYGKGDRPAQWSANCITLACTSSCNISNADLALWNTGILDAGYYTIRLVAKDDKDSNVVYQPVNVKHNRLIVKKDGTGEFSTVQAAMNSAQTGDTVLVYAGNYAEQVVMKEAVHLVGAEQGVHIIGGTGVSVTIQNHEFPCSIYNITIGGDGAYSQGTGISINNSSPTIRNCIIQRQGGSSNTNGALRIGGTSKPAFLNCTIRDNASTYGAGLKISASDGVFPAPSFYGCSFTNNIADNTGGAVYLYYSYATPLDTTHVQPCFNSCIFKDNRAASNGSAIYLANCHAPLFTYCEFSNNPPLASYADPVVGFYAGARFTNCTFSNNGGESDGAVLDFHYVPSIGNAAVRVNSCIFAYNDIESIKRTGNYFDVNNTCLYNGISADSIWLNHNDGNFTSNPAFCDRQNDNLHLYSFSPCAPSLSGVDFIGAYDVACSPNAIIYPTNPNLSACPPNSCQDNPTVYVCPGGDYQSLVVNIDLDDTVMTRDIDSTEIELILPNNPLIKFFCNGPIHADSAATSGNGWKTTITYKNISGRAADSFYVALDKRRIGSCKVAFKTFDYRGSKDGTPDGIVNTADLSPFASTYNRCKGNVNYKDCFNFAIVPNDTCVGVADFGKLGTHYGHKAPCLGTSAQKTHVANSDVVLKLVAQLETIDKDRYLNIDVNLENARNLTSVCLALNGDKYGLDFLSWEANAAQEGTIMASPINRDGSNMVFICLVAEEAVQADSIFLGVLRYRVKSEHSAQTDDRISFDKMSLLAFGDVMAGDGTIRAIGDSGVEMQGEVAKYYDYLKNCYPNPFNPTTTIEYSISRDSHVNLSIYNANGQLVRTLVDKNQKKSIYDVLWDGRDTGGRAVATGIYFCRLKTNFFEKSQKLIVLR